MTVELTTVELTHSERDWLATWTREAIYTWQSHGNVESEEVRLCMVEFFTNLERKLTAER